MDTEKLKKDLHTLFADQLASVECFGGAAAVMQNGETVFSETFGERFCENSIFRLASVTKLFTAAAVMKLWEEGGIDLYAPISTYLPDFAHMALGGVSPEGQVYSTLHPEREATVYDLLTHSAGIGADTLGNREYALLPPAVQTSLASVVDYYGKNFHYAFAPGTKAAYSGFAGYDILARIVEIRTGMPFGGYLTDRICRPLALTDTTFQPTDEQYARLVPMHKRVGGMDREIDFKGLVFRNVPRSYEMAGASLIGSLADVCKWAQTLLCGGTFGGVRVLKEETVKKMLAPGLADDLDGLPSGENIGIGCFPITGQHRLPKGTVYSHGAYGTHVLLFPEKNAAAVFLKNSYFDMQIASRATVAFERAVTDALFSR